MQKKQLGQTLLHTTGFWRKEAEQREVLAKFYQLSGKQRVAILSQMDEFGHTPLHLHVQYGFSQEIGKLLQGLTQEEIVQVLSVGRTSNGFHTACNQLNTDPLELFLKLLSPDNVLNFLKHSNSDGYTPFLTACSLAKGSQLVLSRLLAHIPPQEVLALIMISDPDKKTALHAVCRSDHQAAFDLVIDKIPPGHSLFEAKDAHGQTVLDLLISFLSDRTWRDPLAKLLAKMSNDQVGRIAMEHDLLHRLVQGLDTAVLQNFLAKVSEPDYVLLLKKQDKDGYTPMHHACGRSRNTEAIKMLLNKIPRPRIAEILEVRSIDGETCKSLAVKDEYKQLLEAAEKSLT